MSLEDILARIDQKRAELGMSRHAVSVKAGKTEAVRNIVRAIRSGRTAAGLSTVTVKALADALEASESWLLTGDGDGDGPPPRVAEAHHRPRSAQDRAAAAAETVPVLGGASGSALNACRLMRKASARVPRPPGLADVAGAYAIYVWNESMAPLHSQGDLRFVHPHKPPRRGDSVIVRLRNGEAYIKIYESRSGDWIACRQLNPAAQVKYSVDQVASVHRVMTVNEMFGA
jgi:phage repressor protein C with HTH and peptisase S24 domain